MPHLNGKIQILSTLLKSADASSSHIHIKTQVSISPVVTYSIILNSKSDTLDFHTPAARFPQISSVFNTPLNEIRKGKFFPLQAWCGPEGG